jgi:hypothetical protein
MNTAAYFVFALILFAVGAAFVWVGATPAPDDDAAADVFASDPSCAASLRRDVPAGACRTLDATVDGTAKRYHHNFVRVQTHDDYVFLRFSDGTAHEGELDDGDVFVDAVKSGDPARVQQFHGLIVRVMAREVTVETTSAPDATARAKAQEPWAGGILIAAALLCVFFGVKALLRPSQPAQN